MLTHRVVTFDPWRSRVLSSSGTGSLSLWLSTRGNNCADWHFYVDFFKGALRSRIRTYDPLSCGRGDDSGGWGDWRLIPIIRAG
jgi:hypothetical protein